MKQRVLAGLLLGLVGTGSVIATAQGAATLNVRLLQAAERGDEAVVRALLKNGASPNARRADGRTALTSAALGNHVRVARVLIDAGANPDWQDDQRNNALLVSGETGSVAMLREVLRAKPDLTRTNRFGGTALIPAAHRGHVAYVREILKTKINVNHVNNLGWTALLEAVILGDGGARHTEIVRLLLAAGANPALTDREGVTPLRHAQHRGYTNIARLLSSSNGR
ncbi:hypothetical protein DES52_1067 [Deinococcus yavapaiensis KR-236]|uniref:Uncharacterized protein n=1 Tax=Deinococcus yavapaiensis KR-236 TaxID=694435 RepID=A0A318SIP2_9DEIO|nr:hypothetical protein DES52_1067 [Deinococcus yavapaiensis KR-236]